MSKTKQGATVVALTRIVQRPGERGSPPGTLVSIADRAEAERLVRTGRAAWPKAAPAPTPAAPVKPEGEALTAAIAAAIRGLDLSDEEAVTAAGAPQVSALQLALGYPVTAAERDAAWARVQAEGEGKEGAGEGASLV